MIRRWLQTIITGLTFVGGFCAPTRALTYPDGRPEAERRLPATDHGVIHFYEPKGSTQSPPDLHDPLVVGAEAIFFWGDLEPREGQFDWSRVDREIQRWQSAGKLLDIRLATAHNGPNMTPAWLFDQYHVRRIGRGHWCDAEDSLGVFSLGPDGQRTTNAAEVVGGAASIAARDPAAADGVLLRMDHAEVFAPNQEYSLQFDYRSVTGATGWVALVNESAQLTNRAQFVAPAGQRGSFSFPFHTPAATGSHLLWGSGGGQLSLDNLNLLPVQLVPRMHFDGVETGARFWQLKDTAQLTRDPALVITGTCSILISNNAPGYAPALRNHPETFPILRGHGYSAAFEFRALSSATIRLRLVSLAPPFDVLDEQVITLKAGDRGLQKWHYPAFVWRDQTVLEIGLIGPGQVVIDDLRWSRWSDRVTCFPDYFNPVFREKWQQFITAFAERYANHPGIGRISVGGFGRWEEVILDDDVHGILDAQWLARGFTTEKYLDQVTWSMDLYQRLFPHKPLRICLAYGLKKQNDQDTVYRRVAQAAVARGIGLKQNGLSEKYDTWDDITSASYLFNRYRFHPGITLTYETAGQISRVNRYYSQGHPLSVLNRSLIDGTDFLFLYGSDINARHVHKYLGYTSDLLGAPLLTTFYSRLGDFSLVMEHTPSPQEYRNQWLGVREFATDGADPVLTIRAGEHCAATRQDAPHLVFDVDDRQQYHGMFGVVFTVEYLDEGGDEFEVNCFNHFTRRWEKLGHVRKTATGGWKTAAFQKPDWCRSARGDGEDVHADIVINDLGDGIEHIAGVELSFVPAREWRRELLQAAEPASRHEVLRDRLSREIELPEGAPLHWVGIPVWNGNWQRSGLHGRVIALTERGEIVASEKQYAMPADRDWFELPVVPVPGCRRYRLELSDPVGAVGWYRDAQGALAYRLWRYETRAEPASTTGSARDTGTAVAFAAAQPFAGVQFHLAAPHSAALLVQVHRRLGGDTWSAPLTEQKLQPANSTHTLYFEPQTAGEYKLVLSSEHAASLPAPAVLARSLRVLQLERLQPPNFVRPLPLPDGIVLFDARKSNQLPPDQLHGFTQRAGGRHQATLTVAAPRPAIEFSLAHPQVASLNDRLRLRATNRTAVGLVRVYWAGPGQSFSTDRCAIFPLVQNDSLARHYEFAVGLEDTWRGLVNRLRLEWLGNDIRTGTVDLEAVTILNGASE